MKELGPMTFGQNDAALEDERHRLSAPSWMMAAWLDAFGNTMDTGLPSEGQESGTESGFSRNRRHAGASGVSGMDSVTISGSVDSSSDGGMDAPASSGRSDARNSSVVPRGDADEALEKRKSADPRAMRPGSHEVGIRKFVDHNLLKSLKKMTSRAKSLEPEVEARILQLVEAGRRAVGVVLREHVDGLGEIVIRVTQNPHGVSVLLKGAVGQLAPLVQDMLTSRGVRVLEVRVDDDQKRRSLKQEKEGLDALA